MDTKKPRTKTRRIELVNNQIDPDGIRTRLPALKGPWPNR